MKKILSHPFCWVCVLLFALTLTFTSCEQEPEPVTTSGSLTNPTAYNFPEGTTGTITETKIEDSVIAYHIEATFPNGTTVVEDFAEEDDTDSSGKFVVIEKTTKKTTYSDTDTSAEGKKEEIIETKTADSYNDLGAYEEKITTTTFKDGRTLYESKSSQVDPNSFAPTIIEHTIETNSNGNIEEIKSESKPAEELGYVDKNSLTTFKDNSGKITKTVEEIIFSQQDASEFIKSVKTTKTYDAGTLTGITVETFRPALGGINDGSYIKEVKDKTGKVTSKEMEYYFCNEREPVYFSFDGSDKKANTTLTKDSYSHAAFVTNLKSYITKISVSDKTITITEIDGTAQTDEEVYTIDTNYKPESKFIQET